MTVEKIQYGAFTPFAAAANLASLPAGQAAALGAVDNTTTLATGFKVGLNFTAGAATGTVDVFLVESLDGTTYTDGIAPGAAANVAGSLANALLVHTCQVATSGAAVNDRFDLPVLHAPRNWALVVRNNTSAALAATAPTASYLPINYVGA